MTHADKLRTGYSKAFETGWNKIKKEQRIPCRICGSLISKFYAKHHDGLCVKCQRERK
jgi:hypothetical protein